MRWNEAEYVKHAGVIAEQHVVTKKSLNELSEKFAQENKLNPDEIRTLVRLANVATFQEMFRRKDDGDKMVEFETGDPEAVIRNMVNSASAPPESANIHNDKFASEVPDMMREKRLGHKFDPVPETEKVAEEYPVKPAPEDMVVMNLRKLSAEFEIARIAAGAQWEEKLASLSKTFREAPGYGPKFGEFEKSAWSEFGSAISPEMAVLYEDLRVTGPSPSREKIAELQERFVTEDSAELRLLKQAFDARQTYQKMVGAMAWIDENMPPLGR